MRNMKMWKVEFISNKSQLLTANLKCYGRSVTFNTKCHNLI